MGSHSRTTFKTTPTFTRITSTKPSEPSRTILINSNRKMLSKEEVLDAECAVCHQPIQKDRFHYGGVSCYSCRIGMKPELVLSDEDKKRRFKKFLKKKEDERQGNVPKNLESYSPHSSESTPPPLEPLPTKPHSFMSPFHVNLQQLLINNRNNFISSNFLAEKFKSREVLNREEESFNPFNFISSPHVAKANMMNFNPCKETSFNTSSKDSEALKYFSNRGWNHSRTLVNPSGESSFVYNSMNGAELFRQPEDESRGQAHAQDSSLKLGFERRSVITSQAESYYLVKQEPQEEEMPENLSLKRSYSEDEDENSNKNDQYVHKKFRVVSCEKSDDENEEPINLHQPQRQSVIMHSRKAVFA